MTSRDHTADETSRPTDETLVAGASKRAPAQLERGDLIGRYVVLSRLGAGGMGVVFAAYDPELDRKVALKLIHADDGQSTDGHRRLLREAQAMAKLAHPNVITVHDVGTHEGRVFVAMDFVAGKTLGEWHKRDRSWPDVLDVFVRAGRGLAAAHEKGLVHRDFKPDNVMVGRDGRVRVMDFGLARPTGALGHPAEGLTESKDTGGIGTPAYMAPEQHLNLSSDARTDQFSFCVALWEGLYGERPFEGDTMAALAFNVTEGQLREVPSRAKAPGWVRPLLTRGLSIDPKNRWPELAALLDALERGAAGRRRRALTLAGGASLVTGLGAFGAWQLDLEQRRATCRNDAVGIAEVWNDEAEARFREALLDTGISYAASTAERAMPVLESYVRAWRTRYVELCVATEVDLARTDALWAASQQCLDERRRELEALLEVLTEDADANTVQRTVTAVAALGSLEPCADDVWLGRNPVRADDKDGASTSELRQGLWRAQALEVAGRYDDGLALAREISEATTAHESLRLRARARLVAGGLADRVGAYEESQGLLVESFREAIGAGEDDLAIKAATLLTSTVGYRMAQPANGYVWGSVARGLQARVGAHHGAGTLHNNLGSVYQSQGLYAEAERAHAKALASWERALGPDHPHVAVSHSNLGTVYSSQGRYAEAERAHRRTLAIWEKALGPDHPHVAVSHNNLGTLYAARGRYADAEREFAQALAVRERALGPAHPDVATSQSNLGLLYELQGRYADAERAHAKGLAIRGQALGTDHPDLATSHSNLGSVYAAQGRYADAERAHQLALAIREKTLHPDHPHVAISHGRLGRVHQALGRYTDAEHAHAKALAISERALGPNHPNVAVSYNSLGQVYRLQARYADAEHAHAKALAIQEPLGPHHPHVANSSNHLGNVYLSQGRYVDAEKAHGRALAIREQALGPDHPYVATSYNNLANAYERQGRHAEAERTHAKALAIREKSLGPNHPEVANSFSNLGAVYKSRGRYAEAERALGQALAIRQRALGPGHPDLAIAHNNLGTVYRMQGRHAEAERAHAKALAIVEQALGRDHPDAAKSHGNLGSLYVSQRRHAEAERAYGRALAIFEKALGPDHPHVAASLTGLAYARLELGRADEAVRLIERAFAIRTRVGGTEREFANERFLLARALWASKADRRRARVLAAQALDAYRVGGHPDSFEEVEQWLTKHGGLSPSPG